MRPPISTASKFSIQDLVQAIARNNGYDSVSVNLSPAQWDVLAAYMQPFTLAAGQVLIDQGSPDRTLYFVEAGALSVHMEDEDGNMKLALINPGSVVGEGAFFSRLPRSASVVATGPCKLWSLTPIRFTEMANRQPAVALEVAMGLGAVIAKRLANKPKRVAVT
ncbi:MAG: cyclic nucleotide-binding domain-containing protein [Burkholderiales bacterium]|jgi:CRP-like cAMP-binding protein|nr:cyclic nucleotide-binding domain-containing protein [Burkholderiales bacterium]